MVKKEVGNNLENEDVFVIKKYVVILFIVVFVLLLIIFGGCCLLNILKSEKILACGDGTFYNNCSLKKPYFCLNGIFVERASVCGCPDVLVKDGDLCISKYQTAPKNISLKYLLRGEEKDMNFIVYEGMADYVSEIPKSIYFSNGEQPSRRDFKLRNINEKEQRELLLLLVVKIQNIAKNKEDQMRIAVSIVQNIPFSESEEVTSVGGNQVSYSRYAYEVLSDMQGVCGEKSELLAFLLKEIGYGVVLFYYPLENHEAVGVKCPAEFSLDNVGYCFVETTGSSIITDNQNKYLGVEELVSEPEIMLISEGISLGDDLYEYKDAEDWVKINKIIKEKGKINWIKNFKLKKLKEKYGLDV